MNRSLKLPLLIALALGSMQALAVDLGQVQVKSALGQPLLAEIPVHAATPAELQHLTAQLASEDAFARAGIIGGRTTIPLHFSVANTTNGQHVIRITSAAAVQDPFLDLLVEVHTPSGKSVREFAILLDPPGAPALAAPAPVQPQQPLAAARAPAPMRAQPADAAAATDTRARQATSDSTKVPAAPMAGKPDSVTVTRGQTLSSIARSTAPTGVEVPQMLLALKQANPDAFYRDNINALKAGAVLRVPTANEAQTLAVAAAIAEVRRQNGDWRANTTVSPATVADSATRASTSSAPTRAAATANDRLALVPAKDNGTPAGTAAGGIAGKQGGESVETLKQSLLRAKESLASMQQQTADLNTRVKDLTDINGKNEHLLALRDSEIAGLQAKLAAAHKAEDAAQAAAPSTPSPTVATTGAATAASVAVAAGDVAATSSAAAPTVSGSTAVTPAVAATTPTASTTLEPAAAATGAIATPGKFAAAPVASVQAPTLVSQPQVDMTPWYMQTWAWIVGGGAIVLLLLLALLGRRRKPTGEVAGKSPASLADRFGAPPALPGMGVPTADDVDQDELLDQLAEHPDDIGLHLELTTLYYSRRDVEHFEAAAEAMQAHITDPQQDEWQDVVHMGEDLAPTHPLFDHHVELPVHAGDDALQGFDIDDYADDATEAPAVLRDASEPPELPKSVGGYAFDFDLTSHPLSPESASAPEGPLAPEEPSALQVPADSAASAADVDALHAPASSPVAEEAEPSWQFEPTDAAPADSAADALGEFNDDPVDTKLDLARAYLDMGDAEGARAMLGEVLAEGSQTQQDVARELLSGMAH